MVSLQATTHASWTTTQNIETIVASEETGHNKSRQVQETTSWSMVMRSTYVSANALKAEAASKTMQFMFCWLLQCICRYICTFKLQQQQWQLITVCAPTLRAWMGSPVRLEHWSNLARYLSWCHQWIVQFSVRIISGLLTNRETVHHLNHCCWKRWIASNLVQMMLIHWQIRVSCHYGNALCIGH